MTHDQEIQVTLRCPVNLSWSLGRCIRYLSSGWRLKGTDQSMIRCEQGPLKYTPSPAGHFPPCLGTSTGPRSHQMWNSRCHPQRQPSFSQTSHLRLSTFRGGGATPGATLAWQTRRDSSFATALFWWSKCPQCCSRGTLFLQSVLSRRPEEVVGAVGGIWEKRGEGMQKGPLECEHGPEVSRVSVQSCGTWLRASWGGALMSAESRPFWCGARRNEWALAGWQPARLWV